MGLHEVMLEELRDLYSAENQSGQGSPDLAMALRPSLANAIGSPHCYIV
jgi:hypothetical protein